MYFAIIAEDAPNSLELRKHAREAHLARLKILANEGRLLIAGPHPAVCCDTPTDAGFTGSLIVAAFENEASAQSWAEIDPYVQAGVYQRVTIKPFIPVLP